MDNREVLSEEYTIDLLHLAKILWRKAGIIALCAIIAASIGFSIAAFIIHPTYSSTIKLYTNNNSLSLGSATVSLSSGDISASRSLVSTYGEILDSRTTLEIVIERTETPYTYEELSKMIKYGSSNNTEIMFVTVTSEDPYEAAEIANCFAEVLPERVSEIMKGSAMMVVDSAIPVLKKVEPSITKFTAIGFILGFVLCCGVIVVADILDDTIHNEDHILSTYKYPILARIPDLMSKTSQKYSYYGQDKNNKDQ